MQVNTIKSYGCMLVLFLGGGVGITGAQEFEPFQLEARFGYESSKNSTPTSKSGWNQTPTRPSKLVMLRSHIPKMGSSVLIVPALNDAPSVRGRSMRARSCPM